MSLFSGFSNVSTVPAGSLAKASLVGAKTVNGPAPFRVSTRPAAFTAATRVVWSAELTALSMMSLVGYIGCPPTMGVLSAAKAIHAVTRLNSRTADLRFISVSCLSDFAGTGFGHTNSILPDWTRSAYIDRYEAGGRSDWCRKETGHGCFPGSGVPASRTGGLFSEVPSGTDSA